MKSKLRTILIATIVACSTVSLSQATFAVYTKTSEIIKNNQKHIDSITKKLDELKTNELTNQNEQYINSLTQKLNKLNTINDCVKHIQCIEYAIENLKTTVKNRNLKNKEIEKIISLIEVSFDLLIRYLETNSLLNDSSFSGLINEINSLEIYNYSLEKEIKKETENNIFLQQVNKISQNIYKIKENICSYEKVDKYDEDDHTKLADFI